PWRGARAPAFEPQGEVRGHEERQEDEAREIGRRHRKAPLDTEAAIGGEPEQGQAPGLGEALAELPWSGGEVAGQGRKEGIHREGRDRLSRQGQDERRDEEVQGEHEDGDRREEPRTGVYGPPDSATCSTNGCHRQELTPPIIGARLVRMRSGTSA